MSRRLRLASLVALLAAAIGCEQLPARIDESAVVDQYLVQGRYAAACVALESKDPEIASYGAKRIADYPHIKEARDCLCTIYDDKRHQVNIPAAEGLSGTEHDAACHGSRA